MHVNTSARCEIYQTQQKSCAEENKLYQIKVLVQLFGVLIPIKAAVSEMLTCQFKNMRSSNKNGRNTGDGQVMTENPNLKHARP